jgi:hypothetical protein
MIKIFPLAYGYGAVVTDVVATWVSKKFMAGPFKSPPVANFCANSNLAMPKTQEG